MLTLRDMIRTNEIFVKNTLLNKSMSSTHLTLKMKSEKFFILDLFLKENDFTPCLENTVDFVECCLKQNVDFIISGTPMNFIIQNVKSVDRVKNIFLSTELRHDVQTSIELITDVTHFTIHQKINLLMFSAHKNLVTNENILKILTSTNKKTNILVEFLKNHSCSDFSSKEINIIFDFLLREAYFNSIDLLLTKGYFVPPKMWKIFLSRESSKDQIIFLLTHEIVIKRKYIAYITCPHYFKILIEYNMFTMEYICQMFITYHFQTKLYLQTKTDIINILKFFVSEKCDVNKYLLEIY